MANEDHDLDAEVEAIFERERKIKASRAAQHKTVSHSEATLTKSLQVAYAKAEKAHRLATERVDVRVFEC
jgi:hypothetical protein